jgi:hypothetical protein
MAISHDATAESLSYGITVADVAQVYLSPTPYNDAFDEVLDLRKFDFSRHRAAGMAFLPQDNRLILANMVASTPGARIACWRTRLCGAWLLSINDNPVHTLTDVHNIFNNLSLSLTQSCTLLFACPEISQGISNKGLPLIRRDQISQLNIDQLSDRWTPKASLPPVLPDMPKTPTYDIVTDGDVRNIMVTKVMKLTRGKLMKQTDWSDWNESEHLQLDQYDKQFMFGDPVPVEDESAIFHLVWTMSLRNSTDARKLIASMTDPPALARYKS